MRDLNGIAYIVAAQIQNSAMLSRYFPMSKAPWDETVKTITPCANARWTPENQGFVRLSDAYWVSLVLYFVFITTS